MTPSVENIPGVKRIRFFIGLRFPVSFDAGRIRSCPAAALTPADGAQIFHTKLADASF